VIDIENLIVDKVNTAVSSLLTKYPKMKVISEYVEMATEFPLISVVQTDNYTHRESQDTDLLEHEANVTFDVNVFTTGKDKKSAAKSIANTVDEEMQKNLFTRIYFSQIPNVDRSVYRIVMRYTAVVAEGVTEGNTTTYQMYRR
jgi:hypothetical protein